MGSDLGPRERKVLDVVAENQLGHGKPALVEHVLIAYPHEVVDLVKNAIANLDAGGYVEPTRENAGPGLRLTPRGLVSNKYAGEAAAFAERLAAWLHHRSWKASAPKRYTWEELKREGVATSDEDFFLAVTVIDVLVLSGGNDSWSATPPTASWSAPDDLSVLRAGEEISMLQLRANRRHRQRRAATKGERLPLAELVALAERFAKKATVAVDEAERLQAGAIAPREKELSDLQDQLSKLRSDIEARDRAIAELQANPELNKSTADKIAKEKEERDHQRVIEIKLMEQSFAKEMEVMRLQNQIEVAKINAEKDKAVARETARDEAQGRNQKVVAEIQAEKDKAVAKETARDEAQGKTQKAVAKTQGNSQRAAAKYALIGVAVTAVIGGIATVLAAKAKNEGTGSDAGSEAGASPVARDARSAAPVAASSRPITCAPMTATPRHFPLLPQDLMKFYVLYYLKEHRVALLVSKEPVTGAISRDPHNHETPQRGVFLARIAGPRMSATALDSVCLQAAFNADDDAHVVVAKQDGLFKVFLNYRARSDTWTTEGALYAVQDNDGLDFLEKAIQFSDRNWGFYPQIGLVAVMHYSFEADARMSAHTLVRDDTQAAMRREWRSIAQSVSGGIIPGDQAKIQEALKLEAARP